MVKQNPTIDESSSQSRLEQLERQAYQLRILNEAIRELTLLEDQEEILEKFLLIILGTVGTSRGFAVSMQNYGRTSIFESRGIAASEAQILRECGPQIYGVYFNHLDVLEEVLPKQVRLVTVNEPPQGQDKEVAWPADTRVLVQWTLSSDCYGFVGIGPKITSNDYDTHETDFLLSMTEVLMDCLKMAGSSREVRQLNEDLLQKNMQLNNALSHAQKAQSDLDRQVFHFKALSEMARELSGVFDKKKLLDGFLLMAQGAMSARCGFILLFDVQENRLIISRRGDKAKALDQLDQTRVKQLVLSFYPSPACFSLPDFKVQPLQTSHLAGQALDLPLDMGAVFSLDENYFGLMGFCSKITDEEFSTDEEELLTSLTRNFLLSLENVLSFEIIQKLNLDLGRRNYELSKTIEELRETRDRVNVLQKAGNRISSLIKNELTRLERVNAVDFILIFSLTLVLSLTYNLSSPGGTSPIPKTWTFTSAPEIEADWAALKHQNNAAVFVDARPNEFYSQERIADAVSLPLNLFDFVYLMRFANMDPEKELIVYGRNISRRYDEKVAHELSLRGHKNVRILAGGLNEWKKLNMPVEP
ncbi:rhodanese-like domain-containing protein [Desulfonatronovibrio magnus]|uniref:rhodanese-like domain-containing protein n=1 Tax=Desulfonatronovibrio magnus TaxID=698827 RepID=UPI0005EBCAD8|nr:rhodanese-like domain-containing protein [Desulfonatronovibrio magnus]